MRAWLAMVIAGLLSGCFSGTPTDAQAVTKNYRVHQVNWNSGAQIYLFVGIHEVRGKLAVCGLYTVAGDSALTTEFNTQILGTATVKIDGDTVLQGLRQLNEVAFIGTHYEDYVGKPTTCRLTGTTWQPEFSKLRPTVSIPRQRVVI